jgi:hypothetical protein
VHPDDGNLLYAATEVGVFASDDFGAHWSTSNEGPANVVCEEITFAHGAGPRRLVLATLGRGLWTAQVTRPLAVPFGSACAGHASPPQLLVDAQAPARIGRTMTFRGANLQTGHGGSLLAIGLSDQNWAGGPLPYPLDAFGMAGCALQTSIELALLSSVSGAGTAQWDLPVSGNPQLLGLPLFAQMLAPDPAVNVAGLVTSRPIAVTLGW